MLSHLNIPNWKLWKQSARFIMSKKKAAPKKCDSKCSKKCSKKSVAKKCTNKTKPDSTPPETKVVNTEIKQSKADYFYGLIKKAFGYE